MKFQATSLKSDSSKGVSCEFFEFFNNTHFVEYQQTDACELVRYQVQILLSEVCLEEEKEHIKIISG